jgi:hypothetical protein
MSGVIDEIVAGGRRPHLVRTCEESMGVSPFRDDSEIIAAAEDALFVATVIRLRVLEGGFWTDASRQKKLLRWVVRTLGPLAEPVQPERDGQPTPSAHREAVSATKASTVVSGTNRQA